MKKNMILVVFIFSFFNGFAQDDPQKLIDEFFNRYQAKNPSDAVDYIFSTNKWMTGSKDQIDNIKIKLNSAVKVLGTYYGFTLLGKKNAGDHLIIYRILARYERQPLRFNFTFYKANDHWVLYNFSYDDSIEEELK